MMMSLLIIKDLEKFIDVDLRLLVDELKELWEIGVRIYDKAIG